MTVIQELVDRARERARDLPDDGPVLQRTRASFTDAIAGKDRLSVLAEFKRSSPSEPEIAPERGVEGAFARRLRWAAGAAGWPGRRRNSTRRCATGCRNRRSDRY